MIQNNSWSGRLQCSGQVMQTHEDCTYQSDLVYDKLILDLTARRNRPPPRMLIQLVSVK